jgi:hypothetical protein
VSKVTLTLRNITLKGTVFSAAPTVKVESGKRLILETGANIIEDGDAAFKWVVATLAGSNAAGYVDNTGAAAQFNNPSGVAADGAGSVYVTDFDTCRIRRIPLGAKLDPHYLDGRKSSMVDRESRTVDRPGKGVDIPGKVVDTPGKDVDTPGKVVDTPGKVVDTPGKVVDTPGKVVDISGKDVDTPGKDVDIPGKDVDTPGKIVDRRGWRADPEGRRAGRSAGNVLRVKFSPRRRGNDPGGT